MPETSGVDLIEPDVQTVPILGPGWVRLIGLHRDFEILKKMMTTIHESSCEGARVAAVVSFWPMVVPSAPRITSVISFP